MSVDTYQVKVEQDLEAIADFLRRNGRPEPYWTTEQATQEFEFLGFCYGVAVVRRKADGKKGTLVWADGEAALGQGHYGRLYFEFRE